jgi:hypothetical protein
MTNGKLSLKALAAFQEPLADIDAAKGTWVPPLGSGTVHDHVYLGYWVHSDLLNEFVKMLYREAWVDKAFVWRRWRLHRDAFINDHSKIMVASASDLRRLLTSIVRCDRFMQGYLEERLRDGTLYAIARRAADLSRQRSVE